MKTELKPKEFYLKRILDHEKADEVIRGVGYEDGKGCSIGCTLNNYSHAAYEKAGIGPEWLAIVQDRLFECMNADKAKTWTSVITKAIPDRLHGKTDHADWDKVKAKFLIVVLKSALESFDHAKYPDVKKSIDGSIKLWKRKDIDSAEFKSATCVANAANADNAANAADNAAYAATYAANAAYAACVAYAAAYAANAAAWAANAAYAACVAKFDYFADELVKILRRAK